MSHHLYIKLTWRYVVSSQLERLICVQSIHITIKNIVVIMLSAIQYTLRRIHRNTDRMHCLC